MPGLDIALQQALGSNDIFTPSKLLTHRIEFVVEKEKDTFMEKLREKYSPINPTVSNSNGHGEQTKTAELWPRSKVQVAWQNPKNIGVGLVNPANTCYLNSTLQCLMYTAPLINHIQSTMKTCKVPGFCISCSLGQLYNTLHNSGSPCRPSNFIHHLRLIAKHFCYGRQEDAHEFLVHLRDKMIQQYLQSSHQKVDEKLKETTPTHAIFGGRLVSTVTCSNCGYQSDTGEVFLGLGLDVRHSETVQQSLNRLCKKETLSGTNAYKCEKCKRSVAATKQFRIDTTPNTLVLHLKRFQFGGFTGKLKNQVKYPERLDLCNWTKNKEASPYKLHAVLVHAGSSAQCGHYYCFVRSATGAWHCMNDTSVTTCSLQRVLNAEAYMLFYTRTTGSEASAPSSSQVPESTTTNGYGYKSKPKLISDHNPFLSKASNGVHIHNKFANKAPLQSKPATVMAPHQPIKFGLGAQKNKLIKNPTLSNPYLKNGETAKLSPSPVKAPMIGPKLPENFVRKITPTPVPATNGASNTNGHQNGTSHTNGDKVNGDAGKTNGETTANSDPVVSCTTSLSSLDILRASYTDDSSSSTNTGTAQPVLSIKKKKKKKDHEKKTFNWDEKNKEVAKSPSAKKNGGSVFSELAKNGNVKTWQGGDSKTVDTWSSVSNPNKRSRDEYEIELDRGKAKKFKQDPQKPAYNSQKPAKYLFQNAYDNQKKTASWQDNNNKKPMNGQNGHNKWGRNNSNGGNGYKGNFHNKNGGQKKHYNNHRK